MLPLKAGDRGDGTQGCGGPLTGSEAGKIGTNKKAFVRNVQITLSAHCGQGKEEKSMRFTWSKILGIWGLVLIFTVGMGTAVSAEEKEEKYDASLFFKNPFFFAKQGTYIGFTLPYNNIGGDFDGETVLVSFDDIILVPKVEGGLGWGISLGRRGAKTAGELSYLRSYHDVTFSTAKGKAILNIVSIDFKYYLVVDKPVQPYLLLGWNPAAWLTVKDGSASVPEFGAPEVGDATFTAIFQVKSINLGGGLAYYIDPNLSLNVGIIYRLISFERAEGVAFEGPIEDPLDGSGLNFNIGIALTF